MDVDVDVDTFAFVFVCINISAASNSSNSLWCMSKPVSSQLKEARSKPFNASVS